MKEERHHGRSDFRLTNSGITRKAAEHLGLSKHSARKYADELSQYGLIDFTHR
ncbi:hypothetical protein I6E06_08045 [Bifidobacterium boum]|uniref:FaeA/PapI family transcriptional regulator n=1 Tax=Bifidobacterium boum TaxID=78343 RepID=UPI00399D3EAB|nr:hypothetical protein [Bifidobacterium boum]